jgi:hypothetical protein
MNGFSKIEYVDAMYISEDTLENIDLYPHTAYGKIVKQFDDSFVVSMLQSKSNKDIENRCIEKGLMVPKNALLSLYRNHNLDLSHVSIGDDVSVQWNDIVYFEKMVPISCSTMYTEGSVAMMSDTYIVIKNPVTLRTYPLPVKNHPSYTPFYYVLPLSFIQHIEIHDAQ